MAVMTTPISARLQTITFAVTLTLVKNVVIHVKVGLGVLHRVPRAPHVQQESLLR